MKHKIMTDKMLDHAGACDDDRALFRKVFGAKARITIQNVKKAHRRGLPIKWLVSYYPTLFTQRALRQFDAECDALSDRCNDGQIQHSTHRARVIQAIYHLFAACGYPDD